MPAAAFFRRSRCNTRACMLGGFCVLRGADYLMVHALQKVVVVVTGVTTGENLERWAFDIEADKEVTEDGGGPVHEKPMKEITKEIQAIIRQITASVTFLPMLGTPAPPDDHRFSQLLLA
jgi:hypothetical protein